MNIRTLQRRSLVLLIVIPLLSTGLFSRAAFKYGSPGFRVDKTQHGLYISDVSDTTQGIQPGDLIIAINGLPYARVLGQVCLRGDARGSATTTITLRRGRQTLTVTPALQPVTWTTYASIVWPHLLLIATFLLLALTALFQADPEQPAKLFFFMLCWFGTTVASTLPSHFGLLQTTIISFSFFLITLSNWLAFGALAHFTCRFPVDRDLCRSRPWLVATLYVVPPFLTLGLALYVSGISADFFAILQRLRNLFVPFIIIGSFTKHVTDLRHLRSPTAKSQVKLSVAAYWLTFSPYLLFYLLPNLLFDKPFISFRIVLLAGTVLPAAYLVALLRYRLLGVDRLISRTIAYFVVITALALAYAGMLILLKRRFFGRDIVSEDSFLLFIVIVAIAITPLINRAQTVIDRVFFRYRPNDASILYRFSQQLVSTLHFSTLTGLIVHELPKQIQLTRSALLLLDKKYSRLYPEDLRFGTRPWPRSRLVQRFVDGEHVFFCHEEEADSQLRLELSQLRQAGYALALPLRGGSPLTGILLLGAHKDGRFFRNHEIQLLETVANQIAIAVRNSLNYTSLVDNKEKLEVLFSKVVQSEKMAAVGEMSATLAHELKNPLGIIRSSAQYLADAQRSEEINQEMLHYIVDEVDGLNNVITNVLGLAKFKNPHIKPIDVQEEIPALCDQWRHSSDHHPDVHIQCTIGHRTPNLYGDFSQLRQVLLNLLRNSEEALGKRGNIELVVERTEDRILFRLQDDGPGIDAEHSDQLFQNFFTTKEDGLGLGLSVCKQIIDAHHGSIDIRNREEGGAEVTISLPIQPLGLTRSVDDAGRTDESKDPDTGR